CPHAEIAIRQGAPTLIIDGRPYGLMFYTPGGRDVWERPAIAARGFKVLFEMVHGIGWPGEQEAVFDHLDTCMARSLRDAPDALVVLRLYVCNPPHFARDWPDEIMRFNDGESQHFTKWFGMEGVPEPERGYSSFASLVWRENAAKALENYVAHVLNSAYAPHVIGYFLGGGGTEEWYYYENYDERRFAIDYSPAMLSAFRRHLLAKYGQVTRLREAWNDLRVDFDTAAPPDIESRFTPGSGVFWDPATQQRVRDYFYVHNKVMEDALLYLAAAVKRACGRQQIVGTFYGSLQNHWLVKGGQATFKELLRSPDIDFLASPPQYHRRGPGEHGCIRFLNASIKRHGKLWVNESDIRTVLSQADPANPMRDGRALNMADSLACLEREFTHLVCEGASGWWLQPRSNDYRDDRILDSFGRMQHCGQAAVEFDRTSETDIAAVVDQESLLTGPAFAFDTSVHLVSPSLLDGFRVDETCRLGTPVDYYELGDVLSAGVRQYKLYLMLNCFSLTDEERSGIDRLRQGGATTVWMYAPGLFRPGAKPELSLDHTRDLLGFVLASQRGEKLDVRMRLADGGPEYFPDFDPQRTFGGFERARWTKDGRTGEIVREMPGRTRLRERFYGAGGGEVLARFEEGDQPSMVLHRQGKSTDVWIGSVMAPAALLRALARRAGCHLYCDEDEIIYANRSFLAIHTATSGRRTFKLRRPTDVTEVLSGDELAQGARTFTDTIDAFRTRLYFLGDRSAWKKAIASR
ncbi:MAG TPA: hypothetical protein VFI31_13930, partial [Pirellulales bacterium]|nr:hypothetical protein [Pirellulales bacterium]